MAPHLGSECVVSIHISSSLKWLEPRVSWFGVSGQFITLARHRSLTSAFCSDVQTCSKVLSFTVAVFVLPSRIRFQVSITFALTDFFNVVFADVVQMILGEIRHVICL